MTPGRNRCACTGSHRGAVLSAPYRRMRAEKPRAAIENGDVATRVMATSMDLGTPHKKALPADVFADLAAFAEETSATFDVYGHGATLERFEAECASLLGKEAACFFLTGTQAQYAAIEAHATQRNGVALHPTSHIVHHNWLQNGASQSEVFEALSGRHLPDGYRAVRFGRMDAAPVFEEVASVLESGQVGVLVLELPQRMNGGAMISWGDLLKVRQLATSLGVKMHVDGARLWEAQPHYDRPLHEICDVFDSVYVSFYKGVAGLSGAMLLGPRDFMKRARESQGAQGGQGKTMIPYALHCQFKLRRALPDFQRRYEQLVRFVDLLSDPDLKMHDVLRFDPPRPQSAMIHVYIKGQSQEELDDAHAAAMEQSGVRLWMNLRGRGHSDSEFYFEWFMGESNSRVSESNLVAGWTAFRMIRTSKRKEPTPPGRRKLIDTLRAARADMF